MDTRALKDKILQLAIQGKLVPQNENDEPAYVLLEKIKEEKDKLIKAKVIKKEKSLPPITDNEKLFELPNKWEWTRLGEISNIIMGQSPDSTTVSENKGGIEFHQGKASFGKKLIKESGIYCTKPNKIAIPDDILLSVRAPVGTLNITNRELCIGRGLAAIRSFTGIENIFFYYFIMALEKELVSKATGTTFRAVASVTIKEFLLPLPPLEEQKRIVDKVEELFKLIDELNNNKQELLQNISYSRNKVLQLAIQGKLVSQSENDEPASLLLEKIKKEKYKLIKDKVIKKEKSIPDIAEDEKTIELPKGWEWCRLCDITHSRILNDGDWILSANMDERGTVKLIQLGSIGDGKYVEKGFKTITNETFDELKCREICEGDILVNRLLGKKMLACILPKIEGKKITSVDTCFIKPNKDIYNTKFILYLVLSKYFQDKVYSRVAGTTRQRISKGNLITIPFPLPPREEQERIVAKVDAIMRYLDVLEEQMN